MTNRSNFWACWWRRVFLLDLVSLSLFGRMVCPPKPDESRFPQVYLIRTHSGSLFSLIHNESKSERKNIELVRLRNLGYVGFLSPLCSMLAASHESATYQWPPHSDVSTQSSEMKTLDPYPSQWALGSSNCTVSRRFAQISLLKVKKINKPLHFPDIHKTRNSDIHNCRTCAV